MSTDLPMATKFVMDQPGRGRSGFDQSVLHEAKATGNWDMVPTFGRVTRARGPWVIELSMRFVF